MTSSMKKNVNRVRVFVVDSAHLNSSDAIRQYLADVDEETSLSDAKYLNSSTLQNCYDIKYDVERGDFDLTPLDTNAFLNMHTAVLYLKTIQYKVTW